MPLAAKARTAADEEGTRSSLHHCYEGSLDLTRRRIDKHHLLSERAGRLLRASRLVLALCTIRIHEHGNEIGFGHERT